MLYAIDAQGNIAWHCHNPTCRYHNCQGWHPGTNCDHHGESQRGQPAGETITAHISDPGVQHTSENEIILPPCPGCLERGVISRTTVLVHSDAQLTPPVITKDEQTGEILQVAPADHPDFSWSLWRIDADVIKKQVKHPSVDHLTVSQIQELQADIKNKAPNLPTEGLLTEVTTLKINGVVQHPAVPLHRVLADQLKAAGKVYQPTPDPIPEQVYTRAQMEELITTILQQHGLITSPRLPAAPPSTDQPNS
jgi:hypothetical protein